jgi:phage gp29-like protein
VINPFQTAPAGTYELPPARAEDIQPSSLGRDYYPFPSSPLPEDWTLEKVRDARKMHDVGVFFHTVRLRDVISTDPRAFAGRNQRCATPVGLTVDVSPSKERNGKGVSATVADEVRGWFDRRSRVLPHAVRRQILEDTVEAGIAIAQVHWTFNALGGWWNVTGIEPWPLEYAFYDPSVSAVRLVTTEGLYTPRHGDGKWIVIERYGAKSWMNGAIRALSTPWADRQFGVRYRAQFAFRQGSASVEGELPDGTPINSDDGKAFQRYIKNLYLGRAWGVKPHGAKTELIEAKSNAWQAFNDIVKTGDADIAIVYLGQDGSQQKGSVYTSPMFKGVKFDLVQDDAQVLDAAFATGVALPYASINYGAEFCPKIESAVPDPEEADRRAAVARNYEAFGRGVISIRSAGGDVTPDDWARMGDEYGITPPKLEKKLPAFAEPKLPAGQDPTKAKDATETGALKPTPDEKDE